MIFDPLDGTEEFTKGLLGRFGIQGAVLEQMGDVYVPTRSVILMPGDGLKVDEISVLALGPGRGVVVEKNTVQFTTPSQIQKEEIRVHLRGVTMDRWRADHEGASHIPGLLCALSDFGTSLNRKVVQVEGGPSAHGAARMAMREVDLVIWLPPGVPKTLGGDAPKDHDVAPLHAVACALGGWACDLEGKPIRYEESRQALSNGFIASTTLTQQQVIPVARGLLAQLRGSSDN
jgi:3'-phosphoadenosine 5'-phosphosulfate (PAPS) 3'-phosphatase